MGEHEAAEVVPPTQVAHSWRAALRTYFQAAVAFLVGFSAFWPAVEPVVRSEANNLPEALLKIVLPVIVVLGAIAALIAKVMNNPAVNAWLTAHGFGATPKNTLPAAGSSEPPTV